MSLHSPSNYANNSASCLVAVAVQQTAGASSSDDWATGYSLFTRGVAFRWKRRLEGLVRPRLTGRSAIGRALTPEAPKRLCTQTSEILNIFLIDTDSDVNPSRRDSLHPSSWLFGPAANKGVNTHRFFSSFFSVRHGFSATHLFRGKKKMFWWFFSQFFFCFLRTERGFRLFFPNWRRSSSIRLPSHSFSPALTGVVLGANRRPRRFRILRRDKTRETRKMNGGKRLTRRRLSWSCPSFAETNSCPDAWLAVPAVIYRRRKTQDSEREIINSPAHRKTSTLFSSLPTLLHPRLVLIWRGPSRWLIYTKQQLVLGIGHSHKIGSGRWRARALPTWAVPCLVRIR